MAKKKEIRDSNSKKEIVIKMGFLITVILFIFVLYKIFDFLIFSKEKIDMYGENYYQYIYGIKEEYGGNLEIFQRNEEIGLTLENGETIYLDSTPIYYKDKLGQVLFAPEMEIIFGNGLHYKLAKFTNIIRENTLSYVKKQTKKEKKIVDNFFLYDGNDLYFFSEPTKIIIGDKEVDLSPLSYVIVNYRQNIEIYDYEKDEYTIINDEETLNFDVIAKNIANNYTINMSLDSITTLVSQRLLMSNIEKLEEFKY